MIENAPISCKNILGRNRLAADPALGKGHIFGNRFIQMVADHQHIEMFFQRVNGIGARVGLVDDGITNGSPQILIMSGA